MTTESSCNAIAAEHRTLWTRSMLLTTGIIACAMVCCYYSGLFDLERLSEGVPAILQLGGELFPPKFSEARNWLKPLVDTLTMSVAGTFLAVVISLPVALLAARTTSPHPALYAVARTFLNITRSIPELIMGILFVAAVGFGSLPGVLALGVHSVGMVGKFFAEAIEHADHAVVEAVRSTGAGRLQVVLHGIMPQIFPVIADVAIYRWEYNFRASTVMGMVGAGGIGFELMGSLRIMQYQEVAAILIVILVMVTLVDSLGARLRKHLK